MVTGWKQCSGSKTKNWKRSIGKYQCNAASRGCRDPLGLAKIPPSPLESKCKISTKEKKIPLKNYENKGRSCLPYFLRRIIFEKVASRHLSVWQMSMSFWFGYGAFQFRSFSALIFEIVPYTILNYGLLYVSSISAPCSLQPPNLLLCWSKISN